jgi:2-hydroxy-3-keto-5-methylthiopentenyl-1-phosphate phosphatase
MVILCDFDDTAAAQNVAQLILNGFPAQPLRSVTPHWRDLHRQYVNAEISLAEYQENAFSRIGASHAEQASYVKRHVDMRAGFRNLAGYCALNGIELAIVTHSLDFYLQALLEKEGLEHIPYFAVATG